jgi:hypothetical protein
VTPTIGETQPGAARVGLHQGTDASSWLSARRTVEVILIRHPVIEALGHHPTSEYAEQTGAVGISVWGECLPVGASAVVPAVTAVVFPRELRVEPWADPTGARDGFPASSVYVEALWASSPGSRAGRQAVQPRRSLVPSGARAAQCVDRHVGDEFGVGQFVEGAVDGVESS